MSKEQNNTLAAIDIGSAATSVLVGEAAESGLRYLGHGVCESRGLRRGLIAELEKVTECIQQAMQMAESVAGVEIERAVVGVAGSHIKGINSRGGIALGSRPREITREDIRSAVGRARAVTFPPDRQILHLLPQEFLIDEQSGIRDPLGMMGMRMEVNVHMVTASTVAAQNVVTACNRAGISIDNTVFEPLAAAEAVLAPDERELGIAVIDIGAGSTDVIAFAEATVVHTGTVPIGGGHFTNDIAVVLRTPLNKAEKIKRNFGCAAVTCVPEGHEIEVPSAGDHPSRLMSQRLLAEVIEPRARELFEMVRETLRQGGALEVLGAGCVLTGGGAQLNMISDVAESVLRCPARIGLPVAVSKMPTALADSAWATSIGLLLYAHRLYLGGNALDQGIKAKLRSLLAAVN